MPATVLAVFVPASAPPTDVERGHALHRAFIERFFGDESRPAVGTAPPPLLRLNLSVAAAPFSQLGPAHDS